MTLPEEFKRNGYHCLSNGKVFHHKDDTAKRSWSEAPWKPSLGGASFIDPKSESMIGGRKKRGPVWEAPEVADNAYPDGQIADKTIADLKRMKKGPTLLSGLWVQKAPPSFLCPRKILGSVRAGLPRTCRQPRTPEGCPFGAQGPGEIHNYNDRGNEVQQRGMAPGMPARLLCLRSYVDAQIGKIMKTLDDLDLRENTIIVLWGDHGWHLGEHNFWGKHNLMHLSTRSPLIVSAPGFKPGQTCDRLVEFVDLYPTLMDLSGLKSFNQGLEGTSFTPLLENPRLPWKKRSSPNSNPLLAW